MPQSLSNIVVHLVFSTKDRKSTIDGAVRPRLHAYLGGILKELKCHPIAIGGTADHVHILFALARTVTVAKVVESLKTGSNHWLKTQGVQEFSWQNGYGVISVAANSVDGVIRYIHNQEEHHRKDGFEQEYRTLLRNAGVEGDERYMWD